jgi:hypothetical protein
MVFNASFNNISAISWRSVLLVEETGVPGENHRSVASQLTLYLIANGENEYQDEYQNFQANFTLVYLLYLFMHML